MVRRFYAKPPEPPQEFPEISGTEPGILDSSQRLRLLSSPASTLSFASYDPFVATAHEIPDLLNFSLNAKFNPPKTIVIETIPNRGSFWRFVPRAHLDDTVENEGIFPRIVKIGDELYKVSQDQWNIYKLDPAYHCFVGVSPAFTTISPKDMPSEASMASTSTPSHSRMASAVPDNDSDVEMMSIDSDVPRPRKFPPKKSRFDFTESEGRDSPEVPQPKRKAHEASQSLRPAEEEENAYIKNDMLHRNTKAFIPKGQKRSQVESSVDMARKYQKLHMQRAREKQHKLDKLKEDRRRNQDQKFLREVLSEVPPSYVYNGNFNGHDVPDPEEAEECSQSQTNFEEDEEEARRLERLEESRRKIAELEADRPLWEAAKKARIQKEKADDQERERRKAEKKRQEEEKKRELEDARLRKEEEETRKREEQARLRAEKLDKLKQERCNRYFQWNSGPWSPYRAIERYKIVSQYFDAEKFGDDCPLSFHDIPWPTLRHPTQHLPQDMDWEAVKEFFLTAKSIIRSQEYQSFLRASISRFHPDRWSSRNLLKSIASVEERDCVEVAGLSVSKAIGSIWDEWKKAP